MSENIMRKSVQTNKFKIGGAWYHGDGTRSGKPEMNFDLYVTNPSELETIINRVDGVDAYFENITVDEAKALRDELDSFIEWAGTS